MNRTSASQTISNGMPYRILGKTNERVSAIGLGGYHLGHPPDPADAIRIVRSANALNLPTSVVITGCERMEILDHAIDAAKTFQPLTHAEIAAMLAKTKDAAMNGEFEPFKITPQFDGTAQNPQWMA